MPNKVLTRAYLKDNRIIQYSIDSYNFFVDHMMQSVIDSQNVIEPQVEGISIKLGKIKAEKPVIIEANGITRDLYPLEARNRNLTYSARLFLDLAVYRDGVEELKEEIFMGSLPVLLKSKLCYLSTMTKEELKEAGEDYLDPGGYFIVNGTEKGLTILEDLAPNKVMTSKGKVPGSHQAKVFSTRGGFRGKCTVERSKVGRLLVSMPSYNKPIDLITVLYALGMSRNKIIEELSSGTETLNDALLNIELCESHKKEDALQEIGSKAAPGQPEEYQIKRAELLLDHYLLPHIGITPADRTHKAYYLLHMTTRLVGLAYRKSKADDKDHYANKRLKDVGALMTDLFRYAFQFFVKDVAYQFERANVRRKNVEKLKFIARPDVFSERIKYSMATGNWVGGHTGVSQPVDRNNYTSAVAFLRRVTSPLARKHPHYKARDLNGTHYGRLDPNETPEGPNCGLVKNLALFAEISTPVYDSDKEMEALLRKMDVKG